MCYVGIDLSRHGRIEWSLLERARSRACRAQAALGKSSTTIGEHRNAGDGHMLIRAFSAGSAGPMLLKRPRVQMPSVHPECMLSSAHQQSR